MHGCRHEGKLYNNKNTYEECGKMKAYLEVAGIELMERVANCLRDRLLIRLLFRLGCRVSEAFSP